MKKSIKWEVDGAGKVHEIPEDAIVTFDSGDEKIHVSICRDGTIGVKFDIDKLKKEKIDVRDIKIDIDEEEN